MFVCEYSGEVSDPAVWEFTGRTSGAYSKGLQLKKLVTPAEKPEIVIVKMRRKQYTLSHAKFSKKRNRRFESVEVKTSEGFEIVKQIKIRKKYLEKVQQLVAEGHRF